MAATKVVLRTAFNDRFVVGDVVITQEGTELPSKAKADEVMETARRSGVTLYEVTPDAPATVETKNEGGGN